MYSFVYNMYAIYHLLSICKDAAAAARGAHAVTGCAIVLPLDTPHFALVAESWRNHYDRCFGVAVPRTVAELQAHPPFLDYCCGFEDGDCQIHLIF